MEPLYPNPLGIISSSNMGSLFGYRQAGVKKKEWISAGDGNEREGHDEVEGPVDIDKPFIVNGESLMAPGDPGGSPENVINCRCTVAPVVE